MFFQQNNKEMLICQKKKEMLNGISDATETKMVL
jgi:hypothetical protein